LSNQLASPVKRRRIHCYDCLGREFRFDLLC
jgi:hypothetical protein